MLIKANKQADQKAIGDEVAIIQQKMQADAAAAVREVIADK